MKLMLRFLRPHWKLTALTMALLILDVTGALFVPTLVAEMVNLGTSGAPFEAVVEAGIKMALVSLAAGGCSIAGGYACAVLSARVGREMREAIYAKSLTLSVYDFRQFGTASITTRTISDITTIQFALTATLQMIVPAPAICAVALGLTFALDTAMGFILLGVVGAILLIAFFIIQGAAPLFRRLQKLLDRMSAVLLENLTGVRVVRAFRSEGREENRLIAAFADYLLLYSFDSSSSAHTGDMDYAGEKTQCALQLAVELVNDTEGYEHYDAFYQGVERIGGIIRKAREQVADRAKAFAQEYKNDSFLYTMGSGASWASAYMESICIFMEMQWIHSACIHTGEYFHGPFEVTDCNAGFVVQIAEGSDRELDERCLRFLKKYAKRFEVLDAKELGLSTIDPSVVDYFNHSLFNNVYPIYNAALAEARQHPLSTRRYMWKVAY